MHSSQYTLRIDLQPDVCWGSAPNPEVYPLWRYPVKEKTAIFYVAAFTVISHSLRWGAPQRCPFLTMFLVLVYFCG